MQSPKSLTADTNLDEWLESRIEVAAQTILEEDAELARRDVVAEEPIEPRMRFLMETLMFSPANVRRAVVAANSLSPGERHVFFYCFVLGTGFGRYEEQVGIDARHARSLLERAIHKLSDAVGDTE